ncbi:hypothetical protein [Streptomyces sp. NPDC048419]|uniref:hypothetical protein n=1 Tax=Streptomyces sp. NPDC048419 TaxID=3365547 RepID=UPI003722AD01
MGVDTETYASLLQALVTNRKTILTSCTGPDYWDELRRWWLENRFHDDVPETGPGSLEEIRNELILENSSFAISQTLLFDELWRIADEFAADQAQDQTRTTRPEQANVRFADAIDYIPGRWKHAHDRRHMSRDVYIRVEDWQGDRTPDAAVATARPVYSVVEKVQDGLWRGYHGDEQVWKFIRHAGARAPDDHDPGWYVPERERTVQQFGVTPWYVRSTAAGGYEYYDSSRHGPPGDRAGTWLPDAQFRQRAAEPVRVPDAPPGWWVKVVDNQQWLIRSRQAPPGGPELTGWSPVNRAFDDVRKEEQTVVDLLAEIIRMYPELGREPPDSFESRLREILSTARP